MKIQMNVTGKTKIARVTQCKQPSPPLPPRLHIDYLQHGQQSTTLLQYADSHAGEIDFMDTPISSTDQLSSLSLII